jgi:hypothetical protein
MVVKKELIEQKIGEAIGLEKAAQKAVEELKSKGLLKAEHEKKLVPMKEREEKQNL